MTPGLELLFPRDGDVLNRHDGRLEGGRLIVPVRGVAPEGMEVLVNGVPAAREGESFSAEVALSRWEERIEVRAGTQATAARVLCDRSGQRRYRFSVDDNIEWLADLGADPDSYPSLFDHWYLAFWQRMHEAYGAKIHLNIYNQTVDQRFRLAMLPEKWRGEFEENSPWLHLSFHALQDKPDRYYRTTTYDQLAEDFELVRSEIRRFAGETVITSETTVHWAEVPREACRALRDRGIDTLIGLFFTSEVGYISTKYYLGQETAEHIRGREAWRDYSEGFTFVDCDLVVNGVTLEEVEPSLEARVASPHTGEFLELIIHEQYFRPELRYYQPDAQEKTERVIKWAAEQGYEACFWSEGLLGA